MASFSPPQAPPLTQLCRPALIYCKPLILGQRGFGAYQQRALPANARGPRWRRGFGRAQRPRAARQPCRGGARQRGAPVGVHSAVKAMGRGGGGGEHAAARGAPRRGEFRHAGGRRWPRGEEGAPAPCFSVPGRWILVFGSRAPGGGPGGGARGVRAPRRGHCGPRKGWRRARAAAGSARGAQARTGSGRAQAAGARYRARGREFAPGAINLPGGGWRAWGPSNPRATGANQNEAQWRGRRLHKFFEGDGGANAGPGG
jgi:hypothetical protein